MQAVPHPVVWSVPSRTPSVPAATPCCCVAVPLRRRRRSESWKLSARHPDRTASGPCAVAMPRPALHAGQTPPRPSGAHALVRIRPLRRRATRRSCAESPLALLRSARQERSTRRPGAGLTPVAAKQTACAVSATQRGSPPAAAPRAPSSWTQPSNRDGDRPAPSVRSVRLGRTRCQSTFGSDQGQPGLATPDAASGARSSPPR